MYLFKLCLIIKTFFRELVLPEYLKDKEYNRNPIPSDNVYIENYYQWKIYSLDEAITCHREYCDPTVANNPDSFLSLFLEFNLQVIFFHCYKVCRLLKIILA